MRIRFLILLGAILFAAVPMTPGVILLETGDPQRNTTTPGDNSGWQYEGLFRSVLGTPIAPRYFITAQHIGGEIGEPFIFHGETYQTTAFYSDPTTDLRIWQVDHDFPDYAPLYQSGAETGQELRVHGRGTRRGVARFFDGQLRGWDWGPEDNVQRWGRNTVAATISSGGAPYLRADFDAPGLPDEAHLSGGDSSGGAFVLEDGLWKLAAVNYSVDDLYTAPNDNARIFSAVFDARGFYVKDDDGNFVLVPDAGVSVPTSFYSTRVVPRLPWIMSVIGQDTPAIPPENYQNWLRLYYTPAQIADPAATGPSADSDGDGVGNLLEFAFNLDPTYPEPVTMTAGTGLRGLPLIRTEVVGRKGARLTVEYVRRTAQSGSGITYTVQFTSGLTAVGHNPATGGTEVVTPINARWERVKTTDTATEGSGSLARFARVIVKQVP